MHILLVAVVEAGLAGPLAGASGLGWWPAAVCIAVPRVVPRRHCRDGPADDRGHHRRLAAAGGDRVSELLLLIALLALGPFLLVEGLLARYELMLYTIGRRPPAARLPPEVPYARGAHAGRPPDA